MSTSYHVQKNSPYAWYVAVLLSLTHLVSFIDRFVMGLVLVPLKIEFGLSDTELGLLHGTGFVILYVLAALPLGRLADTSNRRNLIIFGIVLWSLAAAACGLADSFGSLFVARIGVGFGEASLVPAAMSLLAAYFGREKLGRAVGIFTTGSSLGMPVAFIGGGALLAWLTVQGGMDMPGFGHIVPWKGLFILTAMPGFMLAILLLTVREPSRIPNANHAHPGIRQALRYIGQNRSAYFWHSTASLAVVILAQCYAAWTPTLFIRAFGFTPAEAGLSVGVAMLIAAPLGNFTGGYLTDMLHHRGIESAPGLVIGLMLVLLIAPAVTFCMTISASLSLLSFGALMFCITASLPAGLAGVQMITPDRLRGLVTACFMGALTLVAVGFGPTMIGLITDYVFADENALPLSLLVATTGVVAIGVTAAWISRPPVKAAMAKVLA